MLLRDYYGQVYWIGFWNSIFSQHWPSHRLVYPLVLVRRLAPYEENEERLKEEAARQAGRGRFNMQGNLPGLSWVAERQANLCTCLQYLQVYKETYLSSSGRPSRWSQHHLSHGRVLGQLLAWGRQAEGTFQGPGLDKEPLIARVQPQGQPVDTCFWWPPPATRRTALGALSWYHFCTCISYVLWVGIKKTSIPKI